MTDQGDPRRHFVRTVNNSDKFQWRSGAAGEHASRQRGAEGGSIMTAPDKVVAGQSWSVWVPARRQWLLARVLRAENGQATLQFDGGYGISASHDKVHADTSSMLSATSLFRPL